jgi:hypothetical protein
MKEQIKIEFMPKELTKSEFDWANISINDQRVGKARCQIEPDMFIIYSVNIFPEFEGFGYGKQFVNFCKNNYPVLLAHNVRFTAIGFWEKMGFKDNLNGHWIYKK